MKTVQTVQYKQYASHLQTKFTDHHEYFSAFLHIKIHIKTLLKA